MKNLMIILLLSLFGWQAGAQEISEKTVPSVVLNSFQQRFPQAKDLEWEMDQGNYKVEYDLAREEYCTWLDTSGNILKTGHEIKEADLPAPVRTAIDQQFGTYKMDDILQLDQDNTVYYSVELEKGQEEINVLFASDGKVKQ